MNSFSTCCFNSFDVVIISHFFVYLCGFLLAHKTIQRHCSNNCAQIVFGFNEEFTATTHSEKFFGRFYSLLKSGDCFGINATCIFAQTRCTDLFELLSLCVINHNSFVSATHCITMFTERFCCSESAGECEFSAGPPFTLYQMNNIANFVMVKHSNNNPVFVVNLTFYHYRYTLNCHAGQISFFLNRLKPLVREIDFSPLRFTTDTGNFLLERFHVLYGN